MDTINFDCQGCGQNLEAPSDLAGRSAKCPTCGTIVEIVVPLRPVADERDKSATVRINTAAMGGLPPDPQPRRIVLKRSPGK